MNPFGVLFNEIVLRPIFNLLLIFLEVFQSNLGLAIIVTTLLVRGLLRKPSSAGNEMQSQMQDLQPKMQEIQEKYKDDPERMSQETMKLLKKNGSGPLKGCLMMLAQLPIFIGLFWTIRALTGYQGTDPITISRMYSFLAFFGESFFHVVESGMQVFDIESIKTTFLGMDLLTGGNIILAIIAGLGTFGQMKLTSLTRGDNSSKKIQKVAGAAGQDMPDMSKMTNFMSIFMVVMIGGLVYNLPSGVGLYIVTTTIFSVLQFAYQYRQALKIELKALFSKAK